MVSVNVLLVKVEQFAADLHKSIQIAGYQPLLFPSLTIKPIQSTPLPTDTSLIIFISMSAVECGHHLLTSDYQHSKVIAIGKATAAKLEQQSIDVDIVPENASSEALLALPMMQNLVGERIVIVRGVGGRERLKQVLSEHNDVVYREVYERKFTEPNDTLKQVLTQFLNAPKGVIALSNVAGLTGLLALAARFDISPDKLYRYPVAALSERIANAAKDHGFINQIKTAKVSSNAGLVEAIAEIDFGD